ncbi:MAG: glycerophosphodiester phosphodiesterase family protein [Myxococcales bacterium]|nr:glycerophosphodiester phosphodiesterase family protein [Myxococcales bacterium]
MAALLGALALSAGCGETAASRDAGADGAPDARRRLPPLPPASAFLGAERFDCTAAGPFERPTTAPPLSCHRDAGCTIPLIVAHRMGTPFAPENSLAALRASILLGVDIAETDIRLSADGEVVLMHDSQVDRTLLGVGAVSELSLAELRALPMQVEPAQTPGDFECERVPTLDEIFALSRGRIIVELEVKELAAGVQAALYLQANALYDDAFLLCDPAECDAARTVAPEVPIMTRPRDASELAAALAYDPPARLVHIDATDAFLTPANLAAIDAIGAKVYANGFAADALALLADDLSGYQSAYEPGLDVLQVEFPHWALLSHGRLALP